MPRGLLVNFCKYGVGRGVRSIRQVSELDSFLVSRHNLCVYFFREFLMLLISPLADFFEMFSKTFYWVSARPKVVDIRRPVSGGVITAAMGTSTVCQDLYVRWAKSNSVAVVTVASTLGD